MDEDTIWYGGLGPGDIVLNRDSVMEYDREDTAARAYVGDPCISPPTQLIETRFDRPELVAAGRG